jgi:hypothetical protein
VSTTSIAASDENDPEWVKIRLQLAGNISRAIAGVRKQKEIDGIKSLSRHNPDKVACLLHLFSQGVSQHQLRHRYGFSPNTINTVLTEYAHHLDDFAGLAARLAARSYSRMSMLTEELVEKYTKKVEDGECEPTAKDIRDISAAQRNIFQETVFALDKINRGDDGEKPKMDFEQVAQEAEKRLQELKKNTIEVSDGKKTGLQERIPELPQQTGTEEKSSQSEQRKAEDDKDLRG